MGMLVSGKRGHVFDVFNEPSKAWFLVVRYLN